MVQDAWAREQPLTVHGWVYALQDGLIRDLGISVAAPGELATGYARAVALVDAGEPAKR